MKAQAKYMAATLIHYGKDTKSDEDRLLAKECKGKDRCVNRRLQKHVWLVLLDVQEDL